MYLVSFIVVTMSRSQPSNSSGRCMHCNQFFHRLAAHMVSSETCMLASQDSLSNKRLCCDDDINVLSRNNINLQLCNGSVAKKSNIEEDQYTSDEDFSKKKKVCSQQSKIHSIERNNTSDEDMRSNLLSDVSAHCGIDIGNSSNYDNNDSKPSPTDTEGSSSIGTVHVLPIDSDMFHRAFTPEEHFMINLCHVCDEANAPLDIVDKIVAVFRDAQNNGLNMESNIIRSRDYFLKHLNKRFPVPIPESVKVTIEDLSGNEQTITVIRQNFLLQAMDLIHDHEIWGSENNFIGTVHMDDPFNPFNHGRCDNKVDEVVDGVWYKQTVEECATIANGERFLVLGLICYCDKTGTDIYQRNSLEPFSFTFCIFNREC